MRISKLQQSLKVKVRQYKVNLGNKTVFINSKRNRDVPQPFNTY